MKDYFHNRGFIIPERGGTNSSPSPLSVKYRDLALHHRHPASLHTRPHVNMPLNRKRICICEIKKNSDMNQEKSKVIMEKSLSLSSPFSRSPSSSLSASAFVRSHNSVVVSIEPSRTRVILSVGR